MLAHCLCWGVPRSLTPLRPLLAPPLQDLVGVALYDAPYHVFNRHNEIWAWPEEQVGGGRGRSGRHVRGKV